MALRCLCMTVHHAIKTKKKQDFLSSNRSTDQWLGNRPDLNPIENCWQKMKKTMSEKKSTQLGYPQGRAEKSVVPGDDAKLFLKFK